MSDLSPHTSNTPAPSEEQRRLFDHRFRFTERGSVVVEKLYALGEEQLMQKGYVLPPEQAPPLPEPCDLDPLDVVQLEIRLPPQPMVILELQELLQRRYFSPEQVAAVFAKDPGLTAWLLKLVNSPYYGFASKVSTVSRAVALIGTRQIQTIAFGGALNSLAVLLPKGVVNMDRFWRHSLAVGIAAQEIWKFSGRENSEQLFVAGLLHDIGHLALAYVAPPLASSFQRSYSVNSLPFYMEEQALINFDHARLGGMLLHRWNMPLFLVLAVLRHHEMTEPQRYPEAAAVHVADALVTAMDIGLRELQPLSPVSTEAWQALSVTTGALDQVKKVLGEKLDAICGAFSLKAE